MKVMTAALALMFTLTLLASTALADAAEGEVTEISLDSGSKLKVQFTWTGSGDKAAGAKNWLYAQESRFGDDGLDRVQSLLVAAFLAKKTVWIYYNSAGNITAVYLKENRNN